MTIVKEQALEKMLKEMNEQHTQAEDVIHNWLCDQDDEKLFEGILKKDRSINGALKYCAANASKVKKGNMAMIPDNVVFGWVFQYFIKEKIEYKEVNAVVDNSNVLPKPKKKEKKTIKVVKSKTDTQMEGEQLDLLDFL